MNNLNLNRKFNFIFQYIGSCNFNYKVLNKADPSYAVKLLNSLIFNQKHKSSHALSCRLEWRLLHETLFLELFSLYRINSYEALIASKISYDITDALAASLGANIYFGKNETMFGTIEEIMSAVYMQVKFSF